MPSLKKNQPYPKIALVGFRGIGKTSIAIKLADHWNTRFISLDEYIKKKHRKEIKRIVAENGWPFFRDEESLCLKEISREKSPILLDTGGGIIEKADGSPSLENINILKELFFSIYLYMPKEKAIQRLQSMHDITDRPDPVGKIRDIYDRREPLYCKTVSLMIDITDASKRETIQRILGSL